MSELIIPDKYKEVKDIAKGFEQHFNALKNALPLLEQIRKDHEATKENLSDHKEVEAQAQTVYDAIRQVRLSSKETHRTFKDDILPRSKAIDGLNRLIREFSQDKEKWLLKIVNHSEEQERERIANLEIARREEIEAIGGNPYKYRDLGQISPEEFDDVLQTETAAVEHAKAQEAEAEAQRKAEQAELEKAREAQRKAEEEAKQLREAKAKAEAEEAKRKQAEIDRVTAERQAVLDKYDCPKLPRKYENQEMDLYMLDEAQWKEVEAYAKKRYADKQGAEQADKQELLAFLEQLQALKVPACKSDNGQKLQAGLEQMLGKMSAWATANINKLS